MYTIGQRSIRDILRTSLLARFRKCSCARVFPDVGSVAPVFAEFDVVAVRRAGNLEHVDELMARAIKTTHAAVVFDPNAWESSFGLFGRALAAQPLLRVEIVKRPDDSSGYIVLPRPGSSNGPFRGSAETAVWPRTTRTLLTPSRPSF